MLVRKPGHLADRGGGNDGDAGFVKDAPVEVHHLDQSRGTRWTFEGSIGSVYCRSAGCGALAEGGAGSSFPKKSTATAVNARVASGNAFSSR